MAKHIGIVGITAEGASLCYKTICSESSKILGMNRHPEISLHNLPFHKFIEPFNKKDWKALAEIINNSIKKLASIGTDFAIIPANSVHFAFREIKKISPIPVLSIVEIAAEECKEKKYKKVGILGVGMTMSDGLFDSSLKKYGIKTAIPSKSEQKIISDVIYNEIVPAKVTNKSINKIINIIKSLKQKCCDAVILGCTELPLVIDKNNSPLPLIDTTRLLAEKALEYSLN